MTSITPATALHVGDTRTLKNSYTFTDSTTVLAADVTLTVTRPSGAQDSYTGATLTVASNVASKAYTFVERGMHVVLWTWDDASTEDPDRTRTQVYVGPQEQEGYSVTNTAQAALIDRVLSNVDELDAPGGEAVAGRDHVYRTLEEAAIQMVRSDAPSDMLFPAGASHEAEANTEIAAQVAASVAISDYVQVPVPEDYGRLLRLTVSGYTVGLQQRDVVTSDGETYRGFVRERARNKTTLWVPGGVTYEQGTTGRPVAFSVPYATRQSGNLVPPYHQALECYPGTTATSAYVTEYLFVPLLAPTEMPPLLVPPLTWLAAALVMAPLDPMAATQARARYLEVLEGRDNYSPTTRARVTSRPYMYLP